MRVARTVRDPREAARRIPTSGSGVYPGSGGRVAALGARHPVAAFYIIAFTVTWAAWFPRTAHAWGLVPFTGAWFDSPVLYIVGGLGPGMAAFAVTRCLYGADGDRHLWAGVLRWRVGMGWYAVALLAYVGIGLAAAALGGGQDSELLDLRTWLGVVPTFLVYVVLAVPEEVGWRGFAQLHLQTRYSALISGLVVGGLWALWHLPLRLHPYDVAAWSPHVWWIVATIAASVLYAWLFNGTGGSILIVIVLHAMGNTVSGLVDGTVGGVAAYDAVVTVAVAVELVIAFGATNLARVRRPIPPRRRPTGAAARGSRQRGVR